jgi:low temperature requirement protein LtrA
MSHHHAVPMAGRDPHETGRAATPLELLFDLTFVIAFGVAADELAQFVAADHVWPGIAAFGIAIFAIAWAWINFSWFASAYDTDDWIYRLTTMLQMVGVLLLALGIPSAFESIDRGDHVGNRVMVLGYVVMRVPMVVQWLRAAKQDPSRSSAAQMYAVTLLVAQVGWVALTLTDSSIGQFAVWGALFLLIELAGPVIAETRKGGTPWHAHHIAERYGLLVIIALGEGLIGTMASLSAVVGPHGPGWSVDVAVLGLAGTALTFGMWWIYFVVPCGEILHVRRERAFGWGYGHILLFGATVAVGAGLHVAAYYIEHHTELGTTGTVLAVALPVALYVAMIFGLYDQLSRTFDAFHGWLLAGSAACLVASVVLAASGVPMEWCVAVVSLTPWVTVVGYETVGHRHNARVLASLAPD